MFVGLITILAVGAARGQPLRRSRFLDSQAAFDDVLKGNSTHRALEGTHKFFSPLSCNSQHCQKGTQAWNQMDIDPSAGPVVIPCGMCVTMNHNSDFLELEHGLDIRGTLSFPNGYRLTIKTPYVIVQGTLEMLATRRVSGEPDLKFLFTGTNQISFVPENENEFVCSALGASKPTPCAVGFKPFVVAGGKVVIRGLPGKCATWVKLEDVDYGGVPSPENFLTNFDKTVFNPNSYCSSWSYMSESFSSNANPFAWTGGYGAFFQVTNTGSFLVSGRRSDKEHAPTWDMLWIRSCLVPGKTYIFSARVKLSKAGTSIGDMTSCALSDDECLWLYSTVKTSTGQFGRKKGYWEQGNDIRYGTWTDFHATFEYIEEELAVDGLFQILQLRGPEAGVDIEIDDVRFSLPDPITLPNPSKPCDGNLVLNGDAGAHSIHPYPMTSLGGYLSVEEEANGNSYFRHTGRDSDRHSILYVLPAPNCLVANGRYRVSASLRIDSDIPIQVLIKIRSEANDKAFVQSVIAECYGINRDTWTTCTAEVALPPEIVGNFVETRLQLETIGAASDAMDIDNLEMELLDGSVTSIIVPADGIENCWGAGAEILITSHTLSYEDSQVRTIMKDPIALDDGFVKLELNMAIVPPTTAKDSPDFAVEVALLSRNILFQGDDDSAISLMGAHFMVMHTSGVSQFIDGAEFQNFGQQGILGRYPIHFHLCADASGAIVKRNSIRNSNQRCIVIHGSNGVEILENVAFETHGHCFMLEDGGEVNNIFRKNLGAVTMAATRPISSEETDHLLPSTFWCSNPQNSWIENVAAGSKDNGFWFELRSEVRGPTATMPQSQGMNPRTTALKIFRKNVAHSNGKHGIRTYPHGFLPSTEAKFLNNFSYRNVGEGIFLHNSKSIAVLGGTFADNRIQIDLDRADDIQIIGASIIGVSESFKAAVESQTGMRSHAEEVIGIEFHGFSQFDKGGARVSSVTFSGFEDTGSNSVALIDVDGEVKGGHFDYTSSVSSIDVEGNVASSMFNFSKALEGGIEDVYIIDLDSSMKPQGNAATGVSTIIMNSDLMKTFVDQSTCESFPSRGYLYCADTCIRTITYAVDPAMTEDYQLRVTNTKGEVVDLKGHFYEDPDPLKRDWIRAHRFFSASLPFGSYDAFFHTGNGQPLWPSHAEVSLKDELCEDSFNAGDVDLKIPVVSNLECKELIRNGDIEDSSSHPDFWLQHASGLQVLKTGGIDGNNAIADVNQNARYGALGQFLDTRCLQRGRQYEVQVWVKLTRNELGISCSTVDNCPVGTLRMRTADNEGGSSFSDLRLDVASSFVRPYNTKDWNMLHGTFTVDARIQVASSVSFFVERQLTGARMSLDNVSIHLLPKVCSELVFNGDFNARSSRFWQVNAGSNNLVMDVKEIQGNWALELRGRSKSSYSPIQLIRGGCMSSGSRYLATARVRLSNIDGSAYFCEPTFATGDRACPRMKLRSLIDVGIPTQTAETHAGGSIAVTDHEMTSDGWYTMTGVFSATESDEQADRLELYWDQVRKNRGFIVDDVSIVPLPENCETLLSNGYSESTRGWRMWVNGGGGKITVVADGSDNQVFKVSNRGAAGDGLYQFIDPTCMKQTGVWQFVARMQLESNTNGQKVACEPKENSVSRGCPPIRVMGWKGNSKVYDEKMFMTNRPTWSAYSFNTFKTEFIVDDLLADCDRVAIGVRQYNLDWDLLIDDISLKPK